MRVTDSAICTNIYIEIKLLFLYIKKNNKKLSTKYSKSSKNKQNQQNNFLVNTNKFVYNREEQVQKQVLRDKKTKTFSQQCSNIKAHAHLVSLARSL